MSQAICFLSSNHCDSEGLGTSLRQCFLFLCVLWEQQVQFNQISSISLQCWVAECSCVEETRQGLWQVKTSSSLTLPSSRCPVQLISTITIYESQVSSLSKMRQGRSHLALVASQGKLYAIGGCASNFFPLGSVEVYDLATNQWSEANPMVVAG